MSKPLDPLEMLLDAARHVEPDRPKWAKSARDAVKAYRDRAPTRPEPNDAERFLGKMDVVQAYADAAYIASIHAHHALWHGLLAYGWDESTEKFGMALADRISKAISDKATKIGMGDGTSSTAMIETPLGWRASERTDGPNESDFFTAGIDVPKRSALGKPDWHFHAIEFHAKDKAEAERRRDLVLDALAEPRNQRGSEAQ